MSKDIRKNRAAKKDLMVSCFVCSQNEPLPTAEDHHRTPRAFGGTDDPENRVWLCPSCHARLHRVQDFLLRGQSASGYDLVASIFPTNGAARGQLWTLAVEAAEAEKIAKDSFDVHRAQQRVNLTIDKDVWFAIKAEAKERKMAAAKYAVEILKKHVETR